MKAMKVNPHHQATLRWLGALTPRYDESWLPQNASEAFLTCVAMGPWGIKRRWAVRDEAIGWYCEPFSEDLSRGPWSVPPFPLKWQQVMVTTLQSNLRERGKRFDQLCQEWTRKENSGRATRDFFALCGCPKGSKVLWLFVRDYLRLPAFPIDRWVARNLKALGLPRDPWYLIEACQEAGVDPNRVARILFGGAEEIKEPWTQGSLFEAVAGGKGRMAGYSFRWIS